MSTAIQLAAPAPEREDEEPAELCADDVHLQVICEQWSAWCRTRRFYGRPSLPASLLGKLTSKTRATGGEGGKDGIASAELAAFHLAVLGQPAEALDRQVFELHYLWRVKNVKIAAAAMGIGRQHWYTLVREFRRRAYSASQEILRGNLDAAQALPSANDNERTGK